MRFYRRYESDGSCKIICMRCFATVGVAPGKRAAAELESRHACGEPGQELLDRSHQSLTYSPSSTATLLRLPVQLRQESGGRLLLPLSGITILLYLVPTVLESLAAAAHFNPWLTVILPGDVAGCAALAIAFGMWRSGLLLYLLLTGCETYLYLSHLAGPAKLAMLTDLVPTAMVIVVLLRFRRRARNCAFI